ncbi:Thioesterase superfamily protein [Zea mays]|nr:Thioesterase superfamily protein [Zea mays]
MEVAAVPRSAAACRAAPLLPAVRAAACHLALPRRAFSASVAAAPAPRRLAARRAADGDSVETAPEAVPIEKRFPPFPSVMDINQIREILPHR